MGSNSRSFENDLELFDFDFRDRHVRIGLTFGGAGVIRGGLTPECAAAVTAVLESLGKKQGPEDDRNQGQRFHDALAEAWAPLPRVRGVARVGTGPGAGRRTRSLTPDSANPALPSRPNATRPKAREC